MTEENVFYVVCNKHGTNFSSELMDLSKAQELAERLCRQWGDGRMAYLMKSIAYCESHRTPAKWTVMEK